MRGLCVALLAGTGTACCVCNAPPVSLIRASLRVLTLHDVNSLQRERSINSIAGDPERHVATPIPMRAPVPLLLFLLSLLSCREERSRPDPWPERRPAVSSSSTSITPRVEIDTIVVDGDTLEVGGRVRGPGRAITRQGDSSTTILDYRLIDSAGDTVGRGFVRGGGGEGVMNPLRDRLPLPIDFASPAMVEFYFAPLGEQAVAAIPINLSTTRRGATATIRIYLGNIHRGAPGACASVFPVARSVRRSTNMIATAVNALLKGVTQEEREKGYRTSLPGGLRLQRVVIDSGVARLTFNSEIDRPLDSCSLLAMRAQIEMTVRQFSRVKRVDW